MRPSNSAGYDLEIFWDLCTLYPEFSCYIYKELIADASTGVDYEGAESNGFLKTCPSCNTTHIWMLLNQSLLNGNFNMM